MSANDLGLAPLLHADDATGWLSTIVRRLVPPDAPCPRLGSDEWRAASEPERLASALQAAKAHYVEGLYLPQRLEDELSAARWAQASADAEAWAEAAGRVVRIGLGPSRAELVERRREVVLPVAWEASS